MNRQQYYKQLPMAKRSLGMDEETYREMLRRHGATEKDGKISASTMAIKQLESAFNHMKQAGYKVRIPKHNGSNLSTAEWRKPRLAKLNAMWIQLAESGHVRDRKESAMHSWCLGQVKGLQRLEWATSKQLNMAVEALKSWCIRVGLEVHD